MHTNVTLESPQMPGEEKAKAFPQDTLQLKLWTTTILSTARLSCEFIIEVANT